MRSQSPKSSSVGYRIVVGSLVLISCIAVVGAIRWNSERRELGAPERRAAWAQIQREKILDFKKTSTDPHAVALWLSVGRDSNGHDCADWGKPPTALGLAILKPLGLCNPESADDMPFLGATIGRYTSDKVEALKLMIASGVNVNEISPDGFVPIRSAVINDNEVVVRMLLAAGADPLQRPLYSSIGDHRSAVEAAEGMQDSMSMIRIRQALRAAAGKMGK